jgi:hypothetical protein
MDRSLNRLKVIFLGLFAAGCLAVLGYHYFWVWPKDRCEKRGGLWAEKWMKCATVYSIETLTRRPLNVPPINTDPKKMEGPSASRPATDKK